MAERFNDFLNLGHQPIPNAQENIPLVNPDIVPEVSEKYKKMKCFETYQDDDHIWSDGYAMSQDFATVIYKTGLGKTLKAYNRSSENLQTVENGENQSIFKDLKLMKDDKSFATVVANYLQIRNVETLELTKSLEVNTAAGGDYYDQTPNLRKIVFNGYGADVAIFDLETNTRTIVPNYKHRNPADALLCLRDSDITVLGFDTKIEFLNIEKNQYTGTLSGHDGRVAALAESNDGKQIISGSSTGEIKFWDKDTLKVVKEMKVKRLVKDRELYQPIVSIRESRDSKHVIVSCRSGTIKIINIETAQVVREIQGQKFFESSDGILSVMNGEKIEFWAFGIGQEATPNEVIIHEGRKLNEEDRFEKFTSKRDETQKGAHWNFYENLEAERLSQNKKFEWGNERIYFEVPLDELPKLKDLIIKAVKDAHIPITFKYIDVEASSSEMIEKDVTRFVVNFTSVDDARKFYQILQNDSEYTAIQPDRSVEYLAHNIDGKAFYAQGFRELREYDRNQILASLKEYTQNRDGSFSKPSGEGGMVTISKEEYEKLVADADINGLLKKVWEKEINQ